MFVYEKKTVRGVDMRAPPLLIGLLSPLACSGALLVGVSGNRAAGWHPQLAVSIRYADGTPRAPQLRPTLVRLRTAALRKPCHSLNMTIVAKARRTSKRVARLVRHFSSEITPADASDLVESIPTKWETRKRHTAVELVRQFAAQGIIVRSATFASLVRSCRKVGELPTAVMLLELLHDAGRPANPSVYGPLMGDLCHAGEPQLALSLEASMVEAGGRPSNEMRTVLLQSLHRSGYSALSIEYARRLCGVDVSSYDLPLYHTLLQVVGRPNEGVCT